MQRGPRPVRPNVLFDPAPDLLHPVHVGYELRRSGLDRRRVPVREREQLQSLPHRPIPRRPAGALRGLPGPPVGFLEPIQKRPLSGDPHGLRPRHYLPHGQGAFLEVLPEGEPCLEDRRSQLFELPFFRVP